MGTGTEPFTRVPGVDSLWVLTLQHQPRRVANVGGAGPFYDGVDLGRGGIAPASGPDICLHSWSPKVGPPRGYTPGGRSKTDALVRTGRGAETQRDTAEIGE